MAEFKDTDPNNLRGLADWLETLPSGEQTERARLADEFRRIGDAIEQRPKAELPEWRI